MKIAKIRPLHTAKNIKKHIVKFCFDISTLSNDEGINLKSSKLDLVRILFIRLITFVLLTLKIAYMERPVTSAHKKGLRLAPIHMIRVANASSSGIIFWRYTIAKLKHGLSHSAILKLLSPLTNKSIIIGTTGFEPATSCAPCKCATKLRYAPC